MGHVIEDCASRWVDKTDLIYNLIADFDEFSDRLRVRLWIHDLAATCSPFPIAGHTDNDQLILGIGPTAGSDWSTSLRALEARKGNRGKTPVYHGRVAQSVCSVEKRRAAVDTPQSSVV